MTAPSTVAPLGTALQRAGATAWTAAILLAALLALWTARLAPEWLANLDLSHGWFTPVLFLVLLHESRTRGRARFLPAGPALFTATGLCLAAGFLLVAIGCLYAVALHWTHALVAGSIGVGTAFALLAALLVASTDRSRLVPFNWPALVAIGLWLLSLPLPPGTYSRLTLHLQFFVTEGVLGSLHLLGIPATRTGNIIDLAHTSVGVEEACSGIRSLLSCIYAAAFFSASLVPRPWARALLIAIAVPLAIGMNFLRSLLLTLLASQHVDIRGTWHDVTGFAILAVTVSCLGALALLLGREGPRSIASPPAGPPPDRPSRGGFVLLAAGYGAIALCAGFFTLMTRPAETPPTPMPDIATFLPTETPGWDYVASTDLYPFTAVLQTDQLVQRTYLRKDEAGLTQLTLYLAYWPPGRVPVSAVAAHTPDICWPGAGWSLEPRSPARTVIRLDDKRELGPAEYRHFVGTGGRPQHVWYWHVYDRRVIKAPAAHSPRELLRTALAFGIRNRGEQLFVRVSSNRSWPSSASRATVPGRRSRTTFSCRICSPAWPPSAFDSACSSA